MYICEISGPRLGGEWDNSFKQGTHSFKTSSSISGTSSASAISASIGATGGLVGVPSTFMGTGCGARALLSVYDGAAKLSDGVDAGCRGRCSDPHGAGRVEAGVLKSPPVDMLEKGRLRFVSSAGVALLYERGRSGANSLSMSSWLRLPSDSSLFSILCMRSASSLIYLMVFG